MTSMPRTLALVTAAALTVLGLAGPATAQEYPPGGAEVTCSTTAVEPGGEVSCGVAAGTFQAGSTVTATLSSDVRAGQAAGSPPLAAADTPTVLHLAATGSSFTLQEEVTADDDGSADATFDLPVDAVLGAVAVTFAGTAPDGSPVQVGSADTVRVVTETGGEDGGGLADTGGDLGVAGWLVLGLLAAGGGLLWASRRRSQDEEDTIEVG